MLPDVIKRAVVEHAMKQREELREYMFTHQAYRFICDADQKENDYTEIVITFRRMYFERGEEDEQEDIS